MAPAKTKSAAPRSPAARRRGKSRLSPGRRQYIELKQQYPDTLLLFRMGDFYETFDDDATRMAGLLDIALTSRDVGNNEKSALAGIPHHALDTYLPKLVESGLKIAIAEQVSDPATTRGIVDRAVVRVITPGTVLEPGLLPAGRNNYLACAVIDGPSAGLAYLDISTSEFVTSELPASALAAELDRLAPAELLADASVRDMLGAGAEDGPSPAMAVREIDETRIDAERAADLLLRQFKAQSLDAFGCANSAVAVFAAGAVLDFLSTTQVGSMPQVTSLRTVDHADYMRLDRRALRDLEVVGSTSDRPGAPTLLSTLDHTRTAPGARMLRSWLMRPLLDTTAIGLRQDAVAHFAGDTAMREGVREILRGFADLERLLNRARTYSATPRDIRAMGLSLERVPRLLEVIGARSNGLKNSPLAGLRPVQEAADLVSAAVGDNPPAAVSDGNVIRPGFNPRLDEQRSLAHDARGAIAAIEADARESTGIKSLKVGYNRVFGYYIEVSRSNLSLVPDEFERRQTLTGGERFITPRLKELEAKILGAGEQIAEIETEIFRRVCGELSEHGDRIMATAAAVAWLDAIVSMAEAAVANGWTRPGVDDSDVIHIRDGRHPVVEAALGAGMFVPNDTDLASSGTQIAIITGPNMSGKSTYIRQVAVLALMAQAGSFVPATEARIGIVDRIFTRAGLSDDISGGQSTFMVEMVEAASILNNATGRSLAVLDEIGRGTSTYDGLAIARAVVEHLHNAPGLGCRALFATHYHEMTALEQELPRAANFRVAVSEEGDDVVFLRRIVPGGADRSYGVHVARLAGMPHRVVARAWELLEQLERPGTTGRADPRAPAPQLTLFGPPAEHAGLLEELEKLDVNEMTPLDALNTLYRLQQMARDAE